MRLSDANWKQVDSYQNFCGSPSDRSFAKASAAIDLTLGTSDLLGVNSPESRRKWALRLVIGSIVATVLNVTLFLTKVITETDLILITLVLSWLAITITAADVYATTDVRVEQEDD